MKLGLGISDFSREQLLYVKQLGVGCVRVCAASLMGPGARGPMARADMQRMKKWLGSYGVEIAVVLLPQGRDTQYWNARFGRPERDREIEDVCETIRVIAEAGVPVVEYTWSVPDVWGSIPEGAEGRGGARVRSFDYDRIKDVPAEPGEGSTAEEMWERLSYFLERVIPAAEDAGVRLAFHPHDPPTPMLKGEARILGNLEGLKRLIEMFPSEANGLNFCQGTVAEMGVDVIEAIRYFGKLDKINHVHFRNVRGAVPRFDESFIDDGDVDMLAAMRAYHEVGYRYALMPDHVPQMIGDTPWAYRGRAYAIGYMKALIKAVADGA